MKLLQFITIPYRFHRHPNYCGRKLDWRGAKKGHETFYTTLNQLSDIHSAECITGVRVNPFLSRNGRFSSVNTPFHLVTDIYCLTQGPGSDGDARP
jgi:hypothetical protein